ncbi:MAG: His-Xaa-Ser system protein HxsD [Desulfovibrionaceae bacterium]
MSHNIVTGLEDGRLRILLQRECYQPEAARAAAYRFTNRCCVLLGTPDADHVQVLFEPLPDADTDLEQIAKAFANEVLDQQLRLELEQRFGDLRDRIVRQAFLPVSQPK